MKGKRGLIVLLSVAILFLWSQISMAEEAKKEEVFDLGEVVITPTRTPKLLGDVSLHTTIITKEEIRKSGARNGIFFYYY